MEHSRRATMKKPYCTLYSYLFDAMELGAEHEMKASL